jgi:TorA maturation chaperone TorD
MRHGSTIWRVIMRVGRRVAILAGAALLAFGVAAPGPDNDTLGALTPAVEASDHDRAIERAFEDVLDREPTEGELRRYRDLMEDEYWTERDVREDLRDRAKSRRSGRRGDPDKIIRRAYEDILDRKPDQDGLRLYRSRMIDDDWTEEDVRKALRTSPEYAKHRKERAEKIVRRVYEDVLGREPDSKGMTSYRAKVMNQDWSERDVRDALKKSHEYREKGRVTQEQAEEIVRRAYESALGREPDAGSRGFVDKILRDGWTEKDVARELKKSAEYRDKQR